MATLTLPAGSRGVARMDLLETLLAGLPEGVVQWAAPVASPADLPDADVIVAADGVHSAVRNAVFPRARLRDAGTVAFRGVARRSRLPGGRSVGRGLIFGRAPLPAAAPTGTQRCPHGPRREFRDDDPLAILQRLYRDWHPAVQEVLHWPHAGHDRPSRPVKEALPLKGTSTNVASSATPPTRSPPTFSAAAAKSLVGQAERSGEALTATPRVAEGLANYDATRRRASQNAVRTPLMSRLSNEQRHPWLRDTLVTGIGRLLSIREPSHKPASIR